MFEPAIRQYPIRLFSVVYVYLWSVKMRQFIWVWFCAATFVFWSFKRNGIFSIYFERKSYFEHFPNKKWGLFWYFMIFNQFVIDCPLSYSSVISLRETKSEICSAIDRALACLRLNSSLWAFIENHCDVCYFIYIFPFLPAESPSRTNKMHFGLFAHFLLSNRSADIFKCLALLYCVHSNE